MRLFNIDGPDGVGKSTVIDKVKHKLEDKGYSVKVVHFPRYETEIGKLIHAVLKNECKMSPVSLQMLYSTDRILFCKNELPTIKEDIVILDRYYTSGVVYGLVDNINYKELLKMQADIKEPEKHFIITAPLWELEERMNSRDSKEKYEVARVLKIASGIYKNLGMLLPTADVMQLTNVKGEVNLLADSIVSCITLI